MDPLTPDEAFVLEKLSSTPKWSYPRIAEHLGFGTDKAASQRAYRIKERLEKLGRLPSGDENEPLRTVTEPVTDPVTWFSFENPKVLLVVVALFLLGNIKHAASMYLRISPVKSGIALIDWIYALAVMGVMDLAVLALIQHGRKYAAAFFSTSIFLLTVLYFVGDDFPVWSRYIAAILFAAILAFGGWEFASLFHDKKQ